MPEYKIPLLLCCYFFPKKYIVIFIDLTSEGNNLVTFHIFKINFQLVQPIYYPVYTCLLYAQIITTSAAKSAHLPRLLLMNTSASTRALKNLAMADHHSKFCNFSYPIVFIC
jgi:hypothetical protein